ncbi:SMI1/KNR4 family protein [Rossellomorea vietnamensis]|uniref:SMI1/KNR4 family protein n=1 Tax=Rossellomorea vietnamensis TaxID=218284 RepID=A0A5D4NKA5_9BACI|nr:SMI1/KNR4 family protein [Rossellomorea vietnamensis]TYS14673.1 SMI1/KNR4 family protein [Rossellomorea vietnamensis]
MKIWSEETEDIYRLPEISQEDINHIEKEIKKDLPESYKELVLQKNGGYLNVNSVLIEKGNLDYIGIDHIYGAGSPGILDSPSVIKEWGLPDHLLIFSGEGNYWFALDYTANTPSVIYIEQESNKLVKVANSFDSFLKNLSTTTTTFTDDELDMKWSKKESDKIFSGNDYTLIEEVLLSFQYDENLDMNWYMTKALELSTHPNLMVREVVVSILRNNAEEVLAEADLTNQELLLKALRNLLEDPNHDIKNEAEDIIESNIKKLKR